MKNKENYYTISKNFNDTILGIGEYGTRESFKGKLPLISYQLEKLKSIKDKVEIKSRQARDIHSAKKWNRLLKNTKLHIRRMEALAITCKEINERYFPDH